MRIFVISIMLLLANILQSTVFDMIRIRGISPNLDVMIIVSFALLRGSKEGTIIGFASGMLMDIIFSPSRGYLAIVGATIGYFCGKFNKDFYKENLVLPFVLTLLSTTIHGFAVSLPFLFRGKINYIYFIKNIIFPEIIYTIILSIIVYQLVYIVNEKVEQNEKTKRKIF